MSRWVAVPARGLRVLSVHRARLPAGPVPPHRFPDLERGGLRPALIGACGAQQGTPGAAQEGNTPPARGLLLAPPERLSWGSSVSQARGQGIHSVKPSPRKPPLPCASPSAPRSPPCGLVPCNAYFCIQGCHCRPPFSWTSQKQGPHGPPQPQAHMPTALPTEGKLELGINTDKARISRPLSSSCQTPSPGRRNA